MSRDIGQNERRFWLSRDSIEREKTERKRRWGGRERWNEGEKERERDEARKIVKQREENAAGKRLPTNFRFALSTSIKRSWEVGSIHEKESRRSSDDRGTGNPEIFVSHLYRIHHFS